MRTFDIRDACWMFLLDRAKAAGNPGELLICCQSFALKYQMRGSLLDFSIAQKLSKGFLLVSQNQDSTQ